MKSTLKDLRVRIKLAHKRNLIVLFQDKLKMMKEENNSKSSYYKRNKWMNKRKLRNTHLTLTLQELRKGAPQLPGEITLGFMKIN
jgi:hypothetical protein